MTLLGTGGCHRNGEINIAQMGFSWEPLSGH